MKEMNKLYIAAPLFNDAEKAFNEELKQLLSPYFTIFLPQEDGGLVADMVKKGTHPDAAKAQVFAMDMNAMESCDILHIVLDGRSVDEGAAFELGYAFAKKKVCVGYQTDARRLMPQGNNAMLEGACLQIFYNKKELLEGARRSFS